jgi:hypothetical protein
VEERRMNHQGAFATFGHMTDLDTQECEFVRVVGGYLRITKRTGNVAYARDETVEPSPHGGIWAIWSYLDLEHDPDSWYDPESEDITRAFFCDDAKEGAEIQTSEASGGFGSLPIKRGERSNVEEKTFHLMNLDEYCYFSQYIHKLLTEADCEVTVRMEENNLPFLRIPTRDSYIYVSIEDIFPALKKHHRINYEPCHHSALDAE